MGAVKLESRINRPIFVFGCCNSGTTILWKTLLSHKDICGPKIEGQDLDGLPDSMKHYLGNTTFRLWAHPKFKLCYYRTEEDYNQEEMNQIINVYSQFAKEGKRFITKSPADTLRARLIQAYFPDATFISIVRNGYAVSEGIIRKRKYDPLRPKYAGLETTIEEAAEQWFRANIMIASHQSYLKKYMVIKYEDLVKNPTDRLSSVLDFCKLDKINFQYPIFKKELNLEQISRLSEHEIDVITSIAGPMLIHYGYGRKIKVMMEK